MLGRLHAVIAARVGIHERDTARRHIYQEVELGLRWVDPDRPLSEMDIVGRGFSRLFDYHLRAERFGRRRLQGEHQRKSRGDHGSILAPIRNTLSGRPPMVLFETFTEEGFSDRG